MKRGGLRGVREQLWTSRHRFEQRHDELASGLAQLSAQTTELAQALASVSERQQMLFAWQAELRTRLRRTQSLTARVYEMGLDWPARLRAARGQANYSQAYEDPDPLISVLIATRHSPQTLCERTLPSVIEQTHANWEALVIGDHCTDDTEDRVAAIGDPRIRFANLPVRENEPADPWEEWATRGTEPWAHGIGLARGLWIAPLSHDDTWDANHLSALLEGAREHGAELVYSRMRAVDAQTAGHPVLESIGAWPPRLGQFNCQASIVHAGLPFLRYDRVCALSSEPNDWNLCRRAWEAGVRFHFVDCETATLYRYDRASAIHAGYAALGMPPQAIAAP